MMRVFGTIKQIDARLMRWLTYSLLYPEPKERPQTRLAVLATLVPVEIAIVGLLLPNNLLLLLTFPFWLNAFYEWRLWYHLRGDSE
jgi:hypothetical protein